MASSDPHNPVASAKQVALRSSSAINCMPVLGLPEQITSAAWLWSISCDRAQHQLFHRKIKIFPWWKIMT